MKKILISYFILLTSAITFAQTDTTWHHKKCAVVLTYDDALNVDLTNAIPALDSLGLKATFYISDYFGGLNSQILKWRSAVGNGHELGNHPGFPSLEGRRGGRGFGK